jgi:hypothetical protein
MNSFKKWPGALFYLSIAALAAGPVRAATLVDTVLSKYGMEAFKKAREIRFTFHGKLIGIGPSHTWIWKPQSDSVIAVDKGISYSRKSMNGKEKDLDKAFVNDMYWLTFPLHLGLDQGIRISVDSAAASSPVKKEPLRRIVIAYMQPEGYTPNDSYELFVAPDGLVKEWVYHKGGRKLGAAFTWENYATFGGVLFSQEHKGLAHIYFTGIEVH